MFDLIGTHKTFRTFLYSKAIGYHDLISSTTSKCYTGPSTAMGVSFLDLPPEVRVLMLADEKSESVLDRSASSSGKIAHE